MAKFSIQKVMRRLSGVPGLRFLDIWLTEAKMVRTQMNQRVGDLTNYYNAVGEGVSDVRGAMGGGPDALDPNVDESGNRISSDEDSVASFGSQPGPAPAGPADALSQNFEDVFFDDGDV